MSYNKRSYSFSKGEEVWTYLNFMICFATESRLAMSAKDRHRATEELTRMYFRFRWNYAIVDEGSQGLVGLALADIYLGKCYMED